MTVKDTVPGLTNPGASEEDVTVTAKCAPFPAGPDELPTDCLLPDSLGG